MTRLTVVRNNGWFGRIRLVRLMADGVEIARIQSGETVEVELPSGAESLYAKMDWGKSKPFSVKEIGDGTTVYINGAFTFNPLRMLGVMPIPISLEEQPR